MHINSFFILYSSCFILFCGWWRPSVLNNWNLFVCTFSYSYSFALVIYKHPTHTLHFSFSFFSFSKILKVPESPHRNKMFDASTNGHKRTALGSVDPNTPGDRERYVSFSFRPLQFFLLSLFLFRQHDKSIDLECVCVRFQTSFCLLTSFAPSTNYNCLLRCAAARRRSASRWAGGWALHLENSLTRSESTRRMQQNGMTRQQHKKKRTRRKNALLHLWQ